MEYMHVVHTTYFFYWLSQHIMDNNKLQSNNQTRNKTNKYSPHNHRNKAYNRKVTSEFELRTDRGYLQFLLMDTR